MTTLEHWKKFMRGDSGDAVTMFADLYAETGDQGTLHNLGLALLDVGNCEMAREIFDTLIKHEVEEKRTADLTYLMRGIASWLEDNHKSAVDMWRLSLDAVYTDEAGGVSGPAMLWYAGFRLGDPALGKEGLRLLKKYRLGTASQTIRLWPGPRAIASYLFEEVDAEVLLHRWKWDPGQEVLESRRLCRARFWIGVKTPEREKKRELFLAASSDKNAILEIEYFLARWELQHL